jgi:NADPH:quinone reductase-like Zn-dependent oxidoreductase
MKAARRDRYGPPDVVEVQDVERPVPTADQVLVQVRAASVNRADLDALYPRWQFLRLGLGLRNPRVHGVGVDMAGVVESVGPDVTRFRPGDDVFADLFNFGQGAFADYVCAPERAFAPMPSVMTHEEAATLPHSALLAVQAFGLRDGGSLRPGAKVLIVGASGNVGPFAVQIAKSLGAEVTGVASTAKLDFVRSLGADHVIDYTKDDPARNGEQYDRIVDVDAHQSVLHWRAALRPHGTYVAMGGSGGWLVKTLVQGPAVTLASGKRMGLMLGWKPFSPADVEVLTRLVAAGTIKPVIDQRFPLDHVVDALRYVDDGRQRGKVLVIP